MSKELENGGPKLEGWQMQEQNARLENAGPKNSGPLQCSVQFIMLICCLQSTDSAFKLLHDL